MTTTIGNVGVPWAAAVDSCGVVTLRDARWSLDWWVGADDGWHTPATERRSRVTQRLVDATPVVETVMRIPSGDVRHHAYAIAGEFVVVEVTNRSPIPVAIAFAVCDRGELAQTNRVGVRDETMVTVDGSPALVLPRSPSQSEPPVFVYPLPHTAAIRVLVPVGGESARVPTSIPTADQVASGWRKHADTGARVVVPDPRLQQAIDANRMFLLLGDDSSASSDRVVLLDRFGFPEEAADRLVAMVGSDSEAPEWLLWALAEHVRITGDEELARLTAGTVARHTRSIAKRQRKRPDVAGEVGLRAAADLLEIADESRAAAHARAAAGGASPDDSAAGTIDRDSLVGLYALLDDATPTWTWPDPRTAADFLSFVRQLLVREVTADDVDGLDLLTLLPDDWLGQGVEVHDAPTHHGLLSYALRWHGDRPALLWDLRVRDGEVRLRAPGVDPSWSTFDPSGDALLAPVAPQVEVT